MNSDNCLIDEKRAAEILGVKPRSLQAWRIRGGGPPYVKISAKCVRYRITDLEEWAAERVVSSTSEATVAASL